MRLVPNWLDILRRAWSIRLIILAALFSGLEVALGIWGGGSIPPGIFAALSGLISAAAFVSRLVAQKGMTNAD